MTKSRDIRRTGIEGKRLRTANLEVRFAPSPLSRARVAIVVPRHRHTVVERNRVRRVLREHLRTTLLAGLPALDIVLKALPGAYIVRAEELRGELTKLGERLTEGTK